MNKFRERLPLETYFPVHEPMLIGKPFARMETWLKTVIEIDLNVDIRKLGDKVQKA